jgi:hypothetical protein
MKFSNQLAILFLAIGLLSSSCKHNDASPEGNACIKGKFISFNCHGILIEPDSKSSLMGQKLKNPFNNQEFNNVVSASIDYDNLAGAMDSLRALPVGTEFYFKYKKGGIPRKTMEYCAFEATITLTYISTQSCPSNEN